jgi:hypothetical protein
VCFSANASQGRRCIQVRVQRPGGKGAGVLARAAPQGQARLDLSEETGGWVDPGIGVRSADLAQHSLVAGPSTPPG